MGCKPRSHANRLKLFHQHIGLVKIVCAMWGWWRAAAAGVEREDFLQHGYIALWQATEKWQRNKGVKFATYAEHKIRWSLQDCVELARFGKKNRVKLQGGHSLFDHSHLTQYEEHDEDRTH